MTRAAHVSGRRVGRTVELQNRIVAAMTEEEFRVLIRESLEEASGTDELLTQEEIAQKFKTSVGTIIKLRAHGMPVEWLLSSPRYDYAACRAWLRVMKGGVQ